MKVPFYYVIKSLLENKQVKIDTDSGAFRISASDSSRFHMIHLPNFERIDLLGSDTQWQNTEQHLTIFESQDMHEGVLSNFHYSGVFIKADSPNTAIKVRAYFDRNHELCLGAIVWSFDARNQKTIKPLSDFLSKMTNLSFLQEVRDLITPIIFALEIKQKKILTDFSKSYEKIVLEMEGISSTQTPGAWEPLMRDRFLQLADKCIQILQQSHFYSNKPAREEALIKIFKQYRTIQVRPLHEGGASSEQLVYRGSQDATKDQTSEVFSATVTDIQVEQDREKESEKYLLQLQTLQENARPLLQQKIKNLDAHNLHIICVELDALIIQDHGFDENTCFSMLDLLITIRQRLEKYSLYLLQDKRDPQWILYQSYIRTVPESILFSIIEADDSQSLRCLLDNQLILPSVTIKGIGEGSKRDFLYNFSYAMKKVGCILAFIENGIPPITMIYGKLKSVLQGEEQTTSLTATLSECIEINSSFIKLIPSEHWTSITDQSECFLLQLRRRELDKIRATLVTQAHKKQPHLKSGSMLSRRLGFFSAAQSENPSLQLIDMGIEFIRTIRFFLPIANIDSALLQTPLFDTLLRRTPTASDDETVSWISKLLLSENRLLYISVILEILRIINSKFEEMEKKGHNKTFLKSILDIFVQCAEASRSAEGNQELYATSFYTQIVPVVFSFFQTQMDFPWMKILKILQKLPLSTMFADMLPKLDSMADPTVFQSPLAKAMLTASSAANLLPFEDDEDDIDLDQMGGCVMM